MVDTQLSTVEIDQTMRSISRDCHMCFLGVFSADRAPQLQHLNLPCCFVQNSDPATKPGQHWLAFSYSPVSPNTILMFDSYGLSIANYPYIAKHAPFKISYANREFLQSVHSQCCGHYCINYLAKLSHGMQPFDVVSSLRRASSTSEDRDRVVVAEVNSMIRDCTPGVKQHTALCSDSAHLVCNQCSKSFVRAL
jgi:hypothetical protein